MDFPDLKNKNKRLAILEQTDRVVHANGEPDVSAVKLIGIRDYSVLTYSLFTHMAQNECMYFPFYDKAGR